MKKYAIVPINFKKVDNDLYIRCVLIEFSDLVDNEYKGTRFIDCSPYFNDKSKKHHYKFEDDGYTLTSTNIEQESDLLLKKRPYHIKDFSGMELFKDICDRLAPTYFICDTDDEAIEYFRLSVYYDCDSEPITMED